MCYNNYGDNMFKEYLKKCNISIYKLAEKSLVPYTTLNELINGKKKVNDCKIKTIENISLALNISIESLLKLLNNSSNYLSNSWEECKNKKYYFPVIVENKNYDYRRIHPLKQKIVNDIYYYSLDKIEIEKIIIFGSSVNIRCNKNSDIDIAVMIKRDKFNIDSQNDISEKIQEITKYNSDIIWLNTLDVNSKLYKNIYSKGVVIYE